MAMGRQGDRQGELMVMWSEMPRSPGHVFYDRLQEVLLGAGFDGFVEEACRAYYAKTMGAPSVPPGRPANPDCTVAPCLLCFHSDDAGRPAPTIIWESNPKLRIPQPIQGSLKTL